MGVKKKHRRYFLRRKWRTRTTTPRVVVQRRKEVTKPTKYKTIYLPLLLFTDDVDDNKAVAVVPKLVKRSRLQMFDKNPDNTVTDHVPILVDAFKGMNVNELKLQLNNRIQPILGLKTREQGTVLYGHPTRSTYQQQEQGRKTEHQQLMHRVLFK